MERQGCCAVRLVTTCSGLGDKSLVILPLKEVAVLRMAILGAGSTGSRLCEASDLAEG